MTSNKSHFLIIVSVLAFSMLLGGILSLIIGLSFGVYVWISPVVTVANSLALGLAVLVSLYVTRYLVPSIDRILPILFLSFALILGAGIIAFSGFFISNPASFLYADNRTITFLLINQLFFITINIITCGFVYFQQKVSQKEKALSDEIVLKQQMELKYLAAKVNPHFLFNSLNMLISQLKSPAKAEETLLNLADLLRYQVDLSEAKTVPLEEELDVVKKYLNIQQMRFGERLSYSVDNSSSGNIPPLIIQPLVENSIKHNIDLTDHLEISVKISNYKEKLVVTVMDSLAKIAPEMMEKGVGLTVTKKRVEQAGGSFLISNGGIELVFHHD